MFNIAIVVVKAYLYFPVVFVIFETYFLKVNAQAKFDVGCQGRLIMGRLWVLCGF